MSRRWYAALGVACALVAGGVAAGLMLAFSGSPAAAAPTKQEYFAKVAAICRIYGPKLDKIPPPIDLSVPAEDSEAARKALPVLRAEAEAIRRLVPPKELRANVKRWNKLNDESISKLDETIAAARQVNLLGVQYAYVAFLVTGVKAQHVGKTIGFPSPPC